MTLLSGISLGLSVIGCVLYVYVRVVCGMARPNSHGDSRWARPGDLKPLVRRTASADGIILGWLGRRLLQSPAEDNVLAFGVQRSGKTSTIAVPTLLAWRGAAVATSTKEELVRLTGRHRACRGPVWIFAPLDHDTSWVERLGLRPVTWNPLDECTTVGTAAELSDVFTSFGRTAEASHWYLSAGNLLSAMFLLERERGGDIASVLSLLNRTPLNGYTFLAAQADGVAGDILTGFSATPEKEAGSIISTARSCLSLWLDERVAAGTRGSTTGARLDIDEFLRDSATLYLVAPAEEAERCRPLFSALLAGLLRRATARARAQGGVLNPRLLLDLDEIANFARIPRLASYVSTGPGQGIQLLLCFHDLAQLERAYGVEDARTIWNNCRARILLPGQGDLKTLEQFSRAMGSETVLYQSTSQNSRGSSSTSQARVGRPLRSVDALRRSVEAILVYANAPPARLTLRRWDQVPDWRALVDAAAAPPDP
jgi:type IV secretion system protein VirD4